MPKLSELADDIEIVTEYNIAEVGEVKAEILEWGHDASKEKWYLPIPKKWYPNARFMIDQYIESEYDNMYENWDERASKCISKEVCSKIQAILEEAFSKDSGVMNYYKFGEPVEIDIFPPKEGEPA